MPVAAAYAAITLDSISFGNTAPGNTDVALGALDFVNGGIIGKVFNPFANIEYRNGGVYKHRRNCYIYESCISP